MPNWNPNFPEVLGLEWLATVGQQNRVWSGASARIMRLPSTVAETIDALHMSVAIDPALRADVRTVIDVTEEGNEVIPAFEPVELTPNSDVEISDWHTESGGTSNLFQSIDDDATRWPNPGPAEDTWIENQVAHTASNPQHYRCTFDASAFDTGGALENARIGWVEFRAIMGVIPTGFRKLRFHIRNNGVLHAPAGGSLRNVHAYSASYIFWFGELNPFTGLPWVPADIVDFDIGGTSQAQILAQTAAVTHFPKVHALQMLVYCVPVENRVAVGVWRRPYAVTGRLLNAQTDSLVSVPSGASGWSKAASVNHLYTFRQSVSPALYGSIIADDVRWNGCYQDLGPDGEPPGISFPPSGLASRAFTHDNFGRPVTIEDSIAMLSRAGYAIALERSDAAFSVDSQPYRLDIVDIVHLREGPGVRLAQRVTPASTQSYLGIRLPVIPPAGTSTLGVSVHRVSDGVQIGGVFNIGAEEARDLAVGRSGIRYVTGFLDAGASLTGGTQYEIRLAVTGAGDWLTFVPDASLAPTATFGGSSDGAVIEGTHQPGRDLVINLTRQPDPPQNVTAAIMQVPVTSALTPEVTTVEHVEVTWDEPVSGMGSAFQRYELERSLDGGRWRRVANLNASTIGSFVDHEVPRDTEAVYRIRAVGAEGRITAWVSTAGVTPTAPGSIAVLTSNHDPSLEVVCLYDPESTYPILAAEGDETVRIHGADYQVVFMEREDRGIGWATTITLNQIHLVGKGGQHVLRPLLDLIRSFDIPYVTVLDHQGTVILGHVEVGEVSQVQPFHRYMAPMRAIPTHTVPIPVEVDA